MAISGSFDSGSFARWAPLALASAFAMAIAAAGEVLIVTSNQAEPYQQARDAARRCLAEAGLTSVALRLEELSEQRLKDLTDGRTAAVLAVGSEAASYLHARLDEKTPLCYCMVADPDAAGLTQGKPTVGVTSEVPVKTQFELVREALPKARCVGVLYRSSSEKARAQVAEARQALPEGWRLEAVAVEDHGSLSKAIDELLRRKVDLVWTWPDAALYNPAGVRALLLSAVRSGTPVYGFSRPFVRAGALLGIGVEPETQGIQAAQVLQALLKASNTPPEPAVHAPQGRVILNLIVAERLSLSLPEGILARATETIRPDGR